MVRSAIVAKSFLFVTVVFLCFWMGGATVVALIVFIEDVGTDVDHSSSPKYQFQSIT